MGEYKLRILPSKQAYKQYFQSCVFSSVLKPEKSMYHAEGMNPNVAIDPSSYWLCLCRALKWVPVQI